MARQFVNHSLIVPSTSRKKRSSRRRKKERMFRRKTKKETNDRRVCNFQRIIVNRFQSKARQVLSFWNSIHAIFVSFFPFFFFFFTVSTKNPLGEPRQRRARQFPKFYETHVAAEPIHRWNRKTTDYKRAQPVASTSHNRWRRIDASNLYATLLKGRRQAQRGCIVSFDRAKPIEPVSRAPTVLRCPAGGILGC